MPQCPYCAKEMTPMGPSCPRCGRELTRAPGRGVPPPVQKAQREPVKIDLKFDLKFRKETLIVLFILDAILLAGIIIYFLHRR